MKIQTFKSSARRLENQARHINLARDNLYHESRLALQALRTATRRLKDSQTDEARRERLFEYLECRLYLQIIKTRMDRLTRRAEAWKAESRDLVEFASMKGTNHVKC